VPRAPEAGESVRAPPWTRGLVPLRQGGAAGQLRRLGVAVETLTPEETREYKRTHAGKGHQWWAPHWAVAVLSAEPTAPGQRWAALRRCVAEPDFADALQTIIDASHAGNADPKFGRYRKVATFVQDCSHEPYSQEDP
jgi:hypothetical protein